MAVLAVYLVLVLASHSSLDPSWSHSSPDPKVRNFGGTFGAWLSDMLLFLFGHSAWWLVVLCLGAIVWGYRRLGDPESNPDSNNLVTSAGFILLLLGSTSLESIVLSGSMASSLLPPGGVFGHYISRIGLHLLGLSGACLFLSAMAAIGFSLFAGISWLNIMERIGGSLEDGVMALYQRWQAWLDRRIGRQQASRREEKVSHEKKKIEDYPPVRIEPPIVDSPLSVKASKPVQQSLFADPADNALPGLALLEAARQHTESVSADTVEYTSRLIERKLADFGVEVKVIAAYPGPVITRYEVEPAVGVKGVQIVNLMKDLARALSLVSIRVVETIPGKTCMGLELPNPKRQIVRLAEIIDSEAYQQPHSRLTIALGKDIAGQPVAADLAKMPHVLVAGTTGSGKSVAINAMILSLLYKATAAEVRLIMVDPKMLELSIYEGIPHLLAPVVTDMKQAANALDWCVAEMERRYRLMSKLGVRNLAGYNQKIRDADKAGESIANPFSQSTENPEPLQTLPTIVVVIDELADLMMVAGKKIEELIARLAQKARAAGIHLILATQRPSVDVITGLIKANIPTRIAFQVSSKIDSRTILDQMGAEALLGQGDMLYLPPGTGYPLRVHGAFVADEEVHHVVEYLKSIGEPDYIDGILSGTADSDSESNGVAGLDTGEEADPLYDEAVTIVIKSRRASISSVQRQLRIGYNRAARLIEQMEAAGLVSAMETNGNRTVLVPAREE